MNFLSLLIVASAKFKLLGWRGFRREGIRTFLHCQSCNWFNWIIRSLMLIFEQSLRSYHSRLYSELLLPISNQLQLSEPSPWLHADSTYNRSWTAVIGFRTLVLYFGEMVLCSWSQVAFRRWFRLFWWINYYVVRGWGGGSTEEDGLLLLLFSAGRADWGDRIDEVFLWRQVLGRCGRGRWIEEVTVNYLLGHGPWCRILCLRRVAFRVQKDLSTLVRGQWYVLGCIERKWVVLLISGVFRTKLLPSTMVCCFTACRRGVERFVEFPVVGAVAYGVNPRAPVRCVGCHGCGGGARWDCKLYFLATVGARFHWNLMHLGRFDQISLSRLVARVRML